MSIFLHALTLLLVGVGLTGFLLLIVYLIVYGLADYKESD